MSMTPKKLVVHCKKEKFDVYIGRPSIWGNPYSHLDAKDTLAGFKTSTREEAIEKYVEWIKSQPELLANLYTLKGKVLGCWCSPKTCHGDILAALAAEAKEELEVKIEHFEDEFSFLSNFYMVDVVGDDGITYPSTEHLFQAYKTLDLKVRKTISKLATPAQAKKAGRALECRKDWDSVKDAVMLDCLQKKFAPGSELAEMLLATENVTLVEGNWWGDTYWGVCKGVGKNRLGKLLMQVRSSLQQPTTT